MKKPLLLLTFLSLTVFTLQAQINYTNYGEEGLRVAMNENLAMDLDQDGVIDFYVNGYQDEIGFSAIFAIGCFGSPSETSYTSFNSRELRIYEEGENIFINGTNLYDYIDDGRGSIYHGDGVFADNWEDGVDQYIGFAMVYETMKDGWMRVAVDREANELVIYEIAYKEQSATGATEGIKAGETGLSSVADLGNSLNNFQMGPNPAIDNINLSFIYDGNTPLNVSVLDIAGKEVYNHSSGFNNGQHKLEISTTTWSAGLYYLQMFNNDGVQTEKITISK